MHSRLQFLRAVSHSVGAHSHRLCDDDDHSSDDDDADADPADVLDVNSQADSPAGDTPDSAERNNDNCEMCLIEPRNPRLALVPCGHRRFCSTCANRVRDEGHGCPIFRSDISFVLTLY